MLEKHQRRVAWLKEHLNSVLAWAKLDPDGYWGVHSAVVVDEHAMSPKLQNVGEPVFSLDELSEDQADFGLEALCTATRSKGRGSEFCCARAGAVLWRNLLSRPSISRLGCPPIK